MKFKPHNNTVLLKRTLKLDQYQNDRGVILKREKVDLYEIVDIAPEIDLAAFGFKIGDIVTTCAIGTDLKDDMGNEFVLMNADYITAKLVEN